MSTGLHPELVEGLSVPSTLGVLLVGVLVSCCLFGITTAQTHLYYTGFPGDRLWLKVMVMAIWLLELAHCISIAFALYNFAVTNFGRPSALLGVTLPIDLATLLSGTIIAIAQSYFIERLRRISGRNAMAIVCWSISLARCALLFLLTKNLIKSKHRSIVEAVSSNKGLYTAVLAAGSALDFFIAVYLFYHMRVYQGGDFQKTSYMIDKVTSWTIETGLLTGVTEGTMLIFFYAMPRTWIWTALFCSLARVFANTLLAMLNGRTSIRSQGYTENLSRRQIPMHISPMVHQVRTLENNKELQITFQYDIF